MSGFNQCTFIGGLTRDPELRYTPGGQAVCGARIAVSRRAGKDDAGNVREKTLFLDLAVWGKRGEAFASYLKKGRPVLVTGTLDQREWQDKDGQKRVSFELNVQDWEFMPDGKGGNGEARDEAPARDSYTDAPPPPPPGGQPGGW